MQTPLCSANYIAHTITKGQTLYAIARQFGTTVEAILAANPALDVKLYYAGDTICIPKPTPHPTGCLGGTPYTVVKGDSFFLIAHRFKVPLADLLAANPGVDPINLSIGQVLCIPTLPTTPPPIPACPAGQTAHVVTTGQTFVDLLVVYNVSYGALVAANPTVDLAKIKAGDRLCIPLIGSRGTCGTGKGPYLMQVGDTLSTMAARFQTTVGALMIANPTYTPTDFIPTRIICLPENAVIGG